jgi:cytosine/adenosine deaminase-related metal-dependent hydrolase
VLLDLARPNMVPTRLDNVTENLLWAADGSEVDTVVSRGRVLKHDGVVLPFSDGTQPAGRHPEAPDFPAVARNFGLPLPSASG